MAESIADIAKRMGGTKTESVADIAAQYQGVLTQEQPQSLSTSGMLSQAAKNAPSSLYNLGAETIKAITSPIQTAKTILDLGVGVVGVLAETAADVTGLKGTQKSPMADKTEMARNVGRYFMNKYGSLESTKQAFASDPASVLADAATIFTAGANLPRVGATSAKIANLVDPLSLSLKAGSKVAGGVGSIAAETLGLTTGAGGASFRQAAASGREGGQRAAQFQENMRGNVPPEEVLNIAKGNLAEIRNIKNAEYRSGMVDISNDSTVLQFNDVDSALNNAGQRVSFKGQVKDKIAADYLQEANDIISNWKGLDPAQYHTPEGFDALKQSVGAILEKIPFEQRNARVVVQGVYDSLKSTISKQSPTYNKVMSDYQNMSDTILQIEKSLLGRGDKASIDTSMRKLQSLMRNNVNTNYGQRTRVAQTLEQMGGQPFMPALAGQALNDFTPRGIQRGVSGLTGIGAYSLGGLPATAGAALASSPRLMGEAAYYGGKMAGAGDYLGGLIPQALKDPRMYNLMYQTQQAEDNR
jgi:hypothetical protein